MKWNKYFLSLLFTAFLLCPFKSKAQQTTQVILGGFKLEPRVATSGSGVVVVKLKNDSLQVHGDFSYLTNPYYGAYIMFGEKGEAGNQVFSLEASLNEKKTGGVFKAEENTFALSEAQKSLLKSGKFYIIVATYDHTTGEIGGRINF